MKLTGYSAVPKGGRRMYLAPMKAAAGGRGADEGSKDLLMESMDDVSVDMWIKGFKAHIKYANAALWSKN